MSMPPLEDPHGHHHLPPGTTEDDIAAAAAAAVPSALNRKCGNPMCNDWALRGRGGLCGIHWEEVQAQTAALQPEPDHTNPTSTKGVSMKAPRKRCLVDGCEKVAKGRCEGRCQVHFKEFLAQLDEADEANGTTGADGVGSQARRTKFFCAVEDCRRQAAGNLKGYCQRHYGQINPDGNAKQRVYQISRKCSYVDPDAPNVACTKLAQGGCNGLCKGHWNVMVASASIDPNAAMKVRGAGGKKAPRCKSAGCDKFSRKKGYCQRHFRELNPEEYKQASAEMDPSITGKRCSVDDCTKWARGRTGMCRRHARELGLLQDEPPRKEAIMPPVEYGVAAPGGQLPVMDVPHEAAEAVAAAEDTAAAAGAAAAVAVGAGYEAEAAPPAVEEVGGVMQGQEEPQDAVQAAVEVVDDLLPAPAPVADPTKCSIAGCDLPPGTGGYKGMCVKHWLETEKHKSVHETTRRRKRCSVDGCDKQAREYGMCHRHGRLHHGDQQNRGQIAGQIAADVADEVLSPSKRRKMDALVDVAAVVDDAANAAAHHHDHHDPHHEMVPGDELDHVAVQDAIEAVTAAQLPDTTAMHGGEDHQMAVAAEAAAEAVAAAAAIADVHEAGQASV